ncbi:Ent-kaurene oxidase [Leucoagaricus sp. SymC.cos]|nr:Ent-kaurene oxidase [Leucoagaricus sp. SymC.cos]
MSSLSSSILHHLGNNFPILSDLNFADWNVDNMDVTTLGTRFAGIFVLTWAAFKYIEAKRSPTTQIKYTLGAPIEEDPYHTAIVRTPLTRNLAIRFDDIKDEIDAAFKFYVPPTEEWTSVPAYDTVMHIVCRTSNRYFTGLPLCRDPGYIQLQERFTLDVTIGARIINCFPDFLKPLVGRYLTTVPRSVERALAYLGPMVKERLTQADLHGSDWPDRPNDLISWLLESAQGYQREVRDIVLRILSINFAAIHTSTISFTQALYDLAIQPQYVAEMREEAEKVIREHGWTKLAMQQMRKIDSFLKESQRLNSIGALLMTRKTLKDWTLSDGTVIPAGTYISLASDAMNREDTSFTDANTFKGFRWSQMREGDGELDSIKHQMVALTLDTIVWGHGRHACPGRFFAVNELKAIFAYVILHYDVQLEGGSMERPENLKYEASIAPNMKAKVMFRKRRSS